MSLASDALIETLCAAAIDAGRAALAIAGAPVEVRHKSDASPVTQADLAAEAIILDHLARACPGIPVVAEEEVAAGRVPSPGECFFLVDPLDGTKEFVAGRDEWTVNIALIEHGRPVLGVIDAPARATLYAASVPGRRAFRERRLAQGARERRETIQARPAPAVDRVAVTSRSHAHRETHAYLQLCGATQFVGIGSSLKFCLIAEGTADIYPRLGPTMEWDTAAGQAIVLAAGGTVSGPDGTPLQYGKPGYRNSWFVAAGAAFAPPPLVSSTP